MQKGEGKAKLSEMKTKFNFMKCFTNCLLLFSCSLMNYFPLVLRCSHRGENVFVPELR